MKPRFLPIPRSARVAGIATLLAACGGDAADLGADLLHDAAAGLSYLADAAADAAEDASTSKADAAEPRATMLEAACDLARSVKYPQLGDPQVEHWASVAVAQEDVRAVWACEGGAPACPSQDGCTGAEIPVGDCALTSGRYAQGKLWVSCGVGDAAWTRVRVYVQ
jgi:hypothetical protein